MIFKKRERHDNSLDIWNLFCVELDQWVEIIKRKSKFTRKKLYSKKYIP